MHHCECCWWLNNIFFLSSTFKPSPLKQTNQASGKFQDGETVKGILSFLHWFQSLDATISQKEGQAFTTVAFLICLQMTWGGLKVESWKGTSGSQSPVGETGKSHRCNGWCDTELAAPPGLTVTVSSTMWLSSWQTSANLQATAWIPTEGDNFSFFLYAFHLVCWVSIGPLFIPASQTPPWESHHWVTAAYLHINTESVVLVWRKTLQKRKPPEWTGGTNQ